jgi:hypothetical protein
MLHPRGGDRASQEDGTMKIILASILFTAALVAVACGDDTGGGSSDGSGDDDDDGATGSGSAGGEDRECHSGDFCDDLNPCCSTLECVVADGVSCCAAPGATECPPPSTSTGGSGGCATLQACCQEASGDVNDNGVTDSEECQTAHDAYGGNDEYCQGYYDQTAHAWCED